MPKNTYRDPIFHGECFTTAIVDIALVIKDNYFGYLYK